MSISAPVLGKRCVLWGFTSISEKIVNALGDTYGLHPIHWFGTSQRCSFHVNEMVKTAFSAGDGVYHGAAIERYKTVYDKALIKFIDQFGRYARDYTHYSHHISSFHGHINAFNYFYDFFADLLIRDRIETVVFTNMPHQGPDLVLYEVAQALGVETLILYQSILPERFFIITRQEDFGLWHTSPQREESSPYPLERKFEKSLFYMYGKQESGRAHRWRAVKSIWRDVRAVFSEQKTLTYPRDAEQEDVYQSLMGASEWDELFERQSRHHHPTFSYIGKVLWKNHPLDAFRLRLWWRAWLRIRQLKGIVAAHKHPFNKFFSVEKLLYFARAREAEKPVDLAAKFVYFPLHLQPELTTSALGGDIYCDQLLALEHLSAMLPDDVLIYVKENPKQEHYMRDATFYKRFSAITKARMVPITQSTYELMEHCLYVATISGTAGWEAITGGKNVLTFGLAWYNCLPGAYRYQDGVTHEQLVSAPIDHEALETAVGEMVAKMGRGVLGKPYEKFVKNFSWDRNAQQVAGVLAELLQRDHAATEPQTPALARVG